MKRPKIGVVSLYDKEKDSLWMLPGYTGAIEAAGGLPVVLPLTENAGVLDQYCEELDGFLFTGGQDVNPAFYRAQPEAAAEQGYTTPPQIFAGGIANFLSVIGLPSDVVFTLINLAVSAFALTSLDSVARVGRLSF